MANTLFDKGREGFLAGEIDWDTAVIKASIYRSWTVNLATEKFVSDSVTDGAVSVAQSAAFSSKTVTAGVADAADITFSAVAAGAAIPYLMIYQASAVTGGSDVATSAQRNIEYIDTTTGVTLPVTPNGGDLVFSWANSGSFIFKL